MSSLKTQFPLYLSRDNLFLVQKGKAKDLDELLSFMRVNSLTYDDIKFLFTDSNKQKIAILKIKNNISSLSKEFEIWLNKEI